MQGRNGHHNSNNPAQPNPFGMATFRRLVFGKKEPGQLRLQGRGFSKKSSWKMHVDNNGVPAKLVNEQSPIEYDQVRIYSNQIQFIRHVEDEGGESYLERATFMLTKNRDGSFTLLGGINDTTMATADECEDDEWEDGLPVRVDVHILRTEK